MPSMPQFLSRYILCCACRQNKAELTLNDPSNGSKAAICEDCAKELYSDLYKELCAS